MQHAMTSPLKALRITATHDQLIDELINPVVTALHSAEVRRADDRTALRRTSNRWSRHWPKHRIHVGGDLRVEPVALARECLTSSLYASDDSHLRLASADGLRVGVYPRSFVVVGLAGQEGSSPLVALGMIIGVPRLALAQGPW
jgi:hypothetical protein